MNKASGGDGIPAELFQILKDDAVKVLHSICPYTWKTQQWPEDWTGKGQFSFLSQTRAMPKNVQTSAQLQSLHTLTKEFLKFSNLGFNNTWTKTFQMFQLNLEEAENPAIKLVISAGSLKKWQSYRKTSTSALLTMPKPLTVWITINCGKSEGDGNTRLPDLPLEKPVCMSGSNS